jgi:hypothetical protein
MSQIRKIDQVALSTEAAEDSLLFIRELRDATREGRRVDWAASTGGAIDLRSLHHLYPPRALNGDAAAAALLQWRAAFRYGLCHYRLGPGFILIDDERPSFRSTYAIADADALAAFERYEQPAPVPTPQDTRAAAFAALQQAGLLLRLGQSAVSLPYRLTRLPLPSEVL